MQLLALALCLCVVAGLGMIVLLLPEPAPSLAPEAVANLGATQLGNPVTAVLLGYRAFDTLLEKIVLLLAVIGVWSLAPDRAWGRAPPPLGRAQAERPLVFLARGAAACRRNRGHLSVLGRGGPTGRRLPGRLGAGIHVAASHARRAADRAADRQRVAAGDGAGRPSGVPGGRSCRFRLAGGVSRFSPIHRQAADRGDRGAAHVSIAAMLAMMVAGPPQAPPRP